MTTKHGPLIPMTTETLRDAKVLHDAWQAEVDQFGRDPDWRAVYKLVRAARQETP